MYKKLIFCYRVDSYKCLNSITNKEEIVNQYFMVTGKNSIVTMMDCEPNKMYIYFRHKTKVVELQDSKFDTINEFLKHVCLYDFCIEALNKRKEFVDERLRLTKKQIEHIFQSGDVKEKVFFPPSVLKELVRKSNFLSFSYEKEWEGTISEISRRLFKDFDSLEEYINLFMLEENPEGIDKRSKEPIDLTDFLGDKEILKSLLDINPLDRYMSPEKGIVKNGKVAKLTSYKELKNEKEAYKIANKIEKIKEKKEYATTVLGADRLQQQQNKLEQKLEEKSSKVIFFEK